MSERAGDDAMREALQACWDEYHELMPDALYEQVKQALSIRVFEGGPSRADGRPPVRGPVVNRKHLLWAVPAFLAWLAFCGWLWVELIQWAA